MSISNKTGRTDKSTRLRHRLTRSFVWPIVSIFLICAITLPCVALFSTEDRLKRILNAFGSLFNAALAVYLGLIPHIREKTTLSPDTFILALLTSLAAAISAVVLAFFDGCGEVAASALIQLVLGPAQNYIFATALDAYKINGIGDHGCRG